MNRSATGILTLVVLVSLFAGPSYHPSSLPHNQNAPQTQETAPQENQAFGKRAKSNQCKTSSNSFLSDLFGTVEMAFTDGPDATKIKAQEHCPENFQIPQESISHTHLIFAILPDPVNTNLALFFDRQTEALEQASHDSGWIFTDAVLPWDNKEYPESSDFRVRIAEHKYEEEKQRQPGLLIFRRAPDLQNAQPELSGIAAPEQTPARLTRKGRQGRQNQAPGLAQVEDRLLVFVIGETTTAGVRKSQFQNAVQIVNQLFRRSSPPATLAILGPSFSGSLDSLSQLLDCSSSQQYPCGATRSFVIYSGSVTDCSSAETFKQVLQTAVEKKFVSAAQFQTLQEYDENAIAQFLRFVVEQRGYQPNEVAILSEDQTVYGAEKLFLKESNPAKAAFHSQCDTMATEAGVVHLYFPREISQLRSAYQRVGGAEAQEVKTPQILLPLDLQSTGTDTDSVPLYARQHTPLSQEAVLMSIATELKRHSTRLLLLRATDPVDKLFLARYLRAANPQARIITMGSDLLFDRSIGETLLRGVMSLTTYTLAPGAEHGASAESKKVHSDRVFPSSDSVGTYNAMKLLLARTAEQPAHAPSGESCSDVPHVHLAQYGRPGGIIGEPTRPPVHLTVLGRDSFWDVAALPSPRHPPSMLKALWQRLFSRSSREVNAPEAENNRTALPLVCDPAANDASQKSVQSRMQVLPVDWQLFWMLVVGMSLSYVYCIWTASIFSSSQSLVHLAPPTPDSRRWLFVASGYIHLALLLALLWAFEYYPGAGLDFAILLFTIALLVVVCTLDLRRRHSRWMAWVFLGFCILTVLGIVYVWRADYIDYMFVLRAVNLTSGVSPLLPILMLLFAGLWGTWYTLSGTSMIDYRRPTLPGMRLIGGTGIDPDIVVNCRGIREEDLQGLLRILRPDYLEVRTGVIVGLVVVAALKLAGSTRPVRTLEMVGYERLLAVFLTIVFVLLISSCIRLMTIWSRLRKLLIGLDHGGFPRGFKALKGFAWSPMWRFGVGNTTVLGQLLRREWQAFASLVNLGVPGIEATQWELLSQVQRVADKYDEAEKNACDREGWQLFRLPTRWFRGIRAQGRLEVALVNRYRHLQEIYAKAGLQALAFAVTQWSQTTESSFSAESGSSGKLSQLIQSLRGTPAQRSRAENADRLQRQVRACEEFVSLLYAIFILVVLLRIRNLVLAVGGMYVFFLLAFSIYPFQPQLSIRLWMISLLAFIVGIVAMVYAQMHRNTTLSHLTDTRPGQLGMDFWVHITGFIAVPLISLIASQFPDVGLWLTSWLQPAMNALK